jgi:Transposase, Mutator family
MAGADRMTIEEVVKQVMVREHGDVVRAALEAVCGAVMEGEVSELIGAELGERRPEDRMTHRNGYRAREWQTRAGTVELQIPKIRQGGYFPSFLEPRRRSEQALLAVVQQAYVCGVSTRRVDQLVESLGCGSAAARSAACARRWTRTSTRSGRVRWRAATPMSFWTRRSRRSTRPRDRRARPATRRFARCRASRRDGSASGRRGRCRRRRCAGRSPC